MALSSPVYVLYANNMNNILTVPVLSLFQAYLSDKKRIYRKNNGYAPREPPLYRGIFYVIMAA
jgi:hypothetical protein